MGVLGISLIVASVVLFCLRPPQWLPRFFATFRQQRIEPPPTRPPITPPEKDDTDEPTKGPRDNKEEHANHTEEPSTREATPVPPAPIVREPEIQVTSPISRDAEEAEEEKENEEEQIQKQMAEEESATPWIPIIHEPNVEVTPPFSPDASTPSEYEPEEPAREAEAKTTPPAAIIQEPSIEITDSLSSSPDTADMEDYEESEEQTTPKAATTPTHEASVPSLVFPDPEPEPEPELEVPSPKYEPPTTTPSLVLPSISTPVVNPPEIHEPQESFTAPSSRISTSPTLSTPSKVSEINYRHSSRIPTPPTRIPTPPRVPGRPTSPRRDISPRREHFNTPERQQQSAIRPPALPSFSAQQKQPIPALTTARSPTPSKMMPPPPAPARSPTPTTMPPPPVPKRSKRLSGIPQLAGASSSSSIPSPRRIPTLDPTPNRTNNSLPIPRRGIPTPSSSLGGGLAPPPTHSSIPKKPSSRQVTLEPGHSPMDWARLAQSPTSDLRNLPPNTPYLRITPSMLKQMNGRKGNDAWSVYGGKVYNVTPYIPFHPGGKGELLRGAGKDATRLFGEVHPWVNYETMLSSCLIGILVEEHEATGGNAMEEMD